MKRILLILVLFVTTIATAQTKTFEKEVRGISKRIDLNTKTQKDTLKKEISNYQAKQIKNHVDEQERLLQLLVQDKTNGKIVSASENNLSEDDVNTFKIGSKVFRFTVNEDVTKEKKRKKKRKRGYNKRTTNQFVFAMGVNNVLENNKLSTLNDSEYKFWQSHFYELGFTWKTRFTKEASQLYFKYGISFLWNNLRLDNNQYHVKNEDMTEIQTFSENLSESRLRHVQLNFPMHMEWDLSKNKKYRDGYVYDKTNRSVRLGIGGFVGFKLGTRQYLEFNNANDVETKQVEYDNFNMNTFNYGLSAYLGYRFTSFYVKYDLNRLFKESETRNISLGIRLDLN